MTKRASVVWFLLLFVAFVNGFFREAVLIPTLGQTTAHVVSTLMLCGGIMAVVYFAILWIRPRSVWDSVRIGGGWLILTLAFELGFGLLRGRSYSPPLLP
jgi:hypothetical protein